MQAAVRANRNRINAARHPQFKRVRFWLICLFFLVWACVIAGWLFWLQVARPQKWIKLAQQQQQRTFEVAPRRGVLYDRNLHELAMTVQVDSIYAAPSEIDDKQSAARDLAALVHTDPEDALTTEEQIAERLNNGHSFAWVARRVTPEVAARVRAITGSGAGSSASNLKGIYFTKEFQRFYPDNEIAAQVLGYVGTDDNGLGGLEQKYEAQLHGVPGRMYTALDARRKVLGSSEHEPEPGRNLVLAIDENIQFLAERALDHAMQRTQAANGTVVVEDVHSGEILALAIRPTFNPNSFRRTTPELLRNHAVSDVYEPGSTFKLVTYAAALEQHVASPDDMIDCQGGQIKLAGRIIHDDKSDRGMGRVTVAQALAKSSDVAAVKLALKVGQERFYQYVRDFGFGSRTGAEMPGETRGLLRPVNKWSPSSIGSIAIGQEIAVTPLQLVSMVSTIANGGIYLPPRVLMPGQVDTNLNGQKSAAALAPSPFKPGGELPNPLPAGAHRVISTLTAAQMRKMMEGVVLYGTGKAAQLNGYSSGGKTGTAQKIDPATGRYSKTLHIASFAGMAPVNNPVIAMAVVIDSPQGDYYGATDAAPVFAEVAQQVLEYLGVAHDIDVRAPRAPSRADAPVVEDASDHTGDINALYAAANELPSDDPLRGGGTQNLRGDDTKNLSAGPNQTGTANQTAAPPANPAADAKARVGGAQTASTAPPKTPPQAAAQQAGAQQQTAAVMVSDPKTLRVPSLIGLPVRKVIEQAAAAGLEVQVSGNGTVREQAPAPGTMVEPGTQIVVRCGR
ncbi:MAG: penicillin-binding protein [Terracidiphilus sp.]|jgi:cell division protein FtsI (penicillin-binding protein 3)